MKNTKNVFLLIISLMALVIFSSEIFFTILGQKADSEEQMNHYLMKFVEKEAMNLETKIIDIGEEAKILSEIIGKDDALSYGVYNLYITEKIFEKSMLFGMGYWFEPFYIDPDNKYYGPYIYREDKETIKKTMKYSGEDYDYFSKKWYQEGIKSEEDICITEPYYDEVLNTVFITASSQIERESEIIGITTVDISLQEISEYIESLQVGKYGEAVLMTGDGMIIGENCLLALDECEKYHKLNMDEFSENKEKITRSKISSSIIEDEFIIVWAPVGKTKMTVVFCYPKDEVFTDIYHRIFVTIIVFSIAMAMFVIVLNEILKRLIERPLKKILDQNQLMISSDGEQNHDKKSERSPSFDNMILLIDRLLEERNSSIVELNDKNDELQIKNVEIQALYQQTTAMNIALNQLLEENREGYLVTVRSLSNAIEAKDKYTQGHCERVTEYALKIGTYFHFAEEKMLELEFASILHDIGKIAIPNALLNKPGKLTEEEYEIIKKHPRVGYNILKDIEFLKQSINIILHHHERIDGKGYPDELKGDEIDLSTKILTVVDAYDAMTSSRPYRKNPLIKEEAIVILMENMGTQFDEKIVKVFIDLIKE